MQQHQPSVTPQEYLERDRRAQTKSEHFNGEIYALTGASPRHDEDAARGWLRAAKEPPLEYQIEHPPAY